MATVVDGGLLQPSLVPHLLAAATSPIALRIRMLAHGADAMGTTKGASSRNGQAVTFVWRGWHSATIPNARPPSQFKTALPVSSSSFVVLKVAAAGPNSRQFFGGQTMPTPRLRVCLGIDPGCFDPRPQRPSGPSMESRIERRGGETLHVIMDCAYHCLPRGKETIVVHGDSLRLHQRPSRRDPCAHASKGSEPINPTHSMASSADCRCS
jgi:hypothetical protein